MSVSTSHELRWFGDGDLPASLGWVDDTEAASSHRVDWYLVGLGDDASCKIRGHSRVDIKWRTASLHWSAGSAAGLQETWKRRSHELRHSPPTSLDRLSRWRRVEKWSQRRTYELRSDNSLSETERIVDIGVAVTLSEVAIETRRLWSVAIDGWGTPADRLASVFGDLLDRAVTGAESWLDVDSSMSYPRLLHHFRTGAHAG